MSPEVTSGVTTRVIIMDDLNTPLHTNLSLPLSPHPPAYLSISFNTMCDTCDSFVLDII